MNNEELNDAIELLEEIQRVVPLKNQTEVAAVGRTTVILKGILRQRLITNVERKR